MGRVGRLIKRLVLRVQVFLAKMCPFCLRSKHLVAVFIPPYLSQWTGLSRAGILSPRELTNARFFSTSYSRMYESGDWDNPANFLAAPGQVYDKVVIFDHALKLRRNPFMLAWFADLVDSLPLAAVCIWICGALLIPILVGLTGSTCFDIFLIVM